MALDLPLYLQDDSIMQTDGATTYLMQQPFEAGLRSVRRALAESGLDVVEELNLSRSIERMLGIVTPACTVLCVWSFRQLEEMILDQELMPGLLPLHVVVSARGNQTDIHVMGLLPCDGTLPSSTLAPVIAMQTYVARTLDKIAMRQSAFSLV